MKTIITSTEYLILLDIDYRYVYWVKVEYITLESYL